MEATDIISITDAQSWLNAPDTDNLKRNIESAIDWVETYTGYYLFQRTKTYQLPSCGYGISAYPIDIDTVKNTAGDTVSYYTRTGVYNTYVFAPVGSIVTATVGFVSKAQVDPILIEAAYKMLTYIYENRDIYVASLPLDIQVFLNKKRRNLV